MHYFGFGFYCPGNYWHHRNTMANLDSKSLSKLTLQKGNTLFLGLTGGIGSGKSAVAKKLQQLGAAIIDTDEIAHSLTGPKGLAMPFIKATFGAEFMNDSGALDRNKMRAFVFQNPQKKQALESITHPLIREETYRLAGLALQAKAPYIVFVIPLLAESSTWNSLLDHIAVVDCPDEIRIQRVMQRSNLSRDEIRQIMAAQASRESRLALANTVIDNSQSIEELHRQTENLHQKLLGL